MMRAMTKTITAGLAALALGLFAAGCGDDNKSGSSTGESEGGAKTACKAAALKGDSGLPAAFPAPGELTLTRTRKDGPTIVVDGYWTSDLDEAYTELKDQVEQAGYKVLFTENEHQDAEISYSAGNRSGQIALKADCSEGGTTRVHITNRPA
jgi:hypothetical protein